MYQELSLLLGDTAALITCCLPVLSTATTSSSMDAPNLNVINDYKREYLWRRLAQTACGGARLRLPFAAPLYVPLLQLLVLAAPALVGVPLTLLLRARLAAPLVGAAAALLALCLQAVGVVVARRAAAQQDVKTSILAQDDEVAFEGVWRASTWAFIVPGKRRLLSLAVHPAAAGLAAAAAAAALSPEWLAPVARHGAALWVLVPLLGWLSVCTGLYSVTAARPPEPASLRALDEWEVAALNRPLHLLLLSAPLLLIRSGWVSPVPDWLVTCDVVCRLTLCALPLLWLLGVIPPMDVALGWLAEQTLLLMCGGTPCVSPSRLAGHLMLGAVLAALVCCLPPAARLLPAAVGGCLLSADLVGLLAWLVTALRRRRRPSLPGDWWRSLLYPLVCMAGAGAVAACARLQPPPPAALPALGAVLLVLAAARVAHVELQRVYCGGLVRNCAYRPAGGGGRVRWLRATALRLHTLVTPLLLTLYVTWETEQAAEEDGRPIRGSPEDILAAVWLARCYRWVWQNPEAALPETAAVFLARLLLPSVAEWGPEAALVAASALRDRLRQLRGKLYMVSVLQTSWLTAKERRRAHVLLALNTVLLPVTVALLALSCLVSAPLLPVCTLPLFVATFPRRPAGRAPSTAQTAGPDAAYYQQMAEPTARLLGAAVWDGCVGFVQAGDYLLLRFEDRLMWVYVAEMGNSYIYFIIKGLELQETSCHAAEATRVDAIFDCAFDEERSADAAGPLAPYWFHALTPLTQLHVPGYSDARSQLTGVIDNAATLAAVEELFPKVLAWCLVRHLLTTDSAAGEEQVVVTGTAQGDGGGGGGGGKGAGRTDSQERYRTALSSPAPPLLADAEWSDGSQGSLLMFEQKRTPALALGAAPWLRQVLDAEDASPGSDGEAPLPGAAAPLVSSTTILVGPAAVVSSPSAAAAEGGSVSPRRSTQLPPIPSSSRRSPPRRAASGVGSGAPSATGSVTASPSRRGSRLRSGSRVAPAPSTPDQPHSPPSSTAASSVGRVGSSRRTSRAAWQPLIPSAPSVVAPPTSAARRLTPPAAWTPAMLPLSSELAAPFPRQWWLRAVSALLAEETRTANGAAAGGSAADAEALQSGVVEALGGESAVGRLMESHSTICQLVDTAYHGTARELQVSSTPARVLALYRDGAAQDSSAGSWVRGAPAVAELARRAYRWSVKLALDSILLGGFDSDDELLDMLKEYGSDWYIGLDSDPGWRQAVLDEKPSLFSLGYDDTRSTYTSHLLSLGEQTVSVGSLSAELIRGVWASLALELLYVTNDDEERYSIQAHSMILRNLTVQAADPPLGYPVFFGPPLRSSHV